MRACLRARWTCDFPWPEFSVWVNGWKWSLQLAFQRMRGMLSWYVYCISLFASAYCFPVFVHFFISHKLKSQSKSVSTTSEMFTEFLDIPALIFFLLLFIWYVFYLKGGCVTYFFLLCATQILLKKTETAFFLVRRRRTDVCLHASKIRGFMGWCWSKVIQVFI